MKLSIWSDDDYRSLSRNAQHLYFVLLTSPQLTYCGVTDWRPRRIAALAAGWTIDQVETAAAELAGHAQRYIVIDEDTEEVLIRSYIRNDGLMDQPNVAVSMRNAHAAVSSTLLRRAILDELRRLHDSHPNLRGWERVADMVADAAVTPSVTGSVTPSVTGSVTPSVTGSVTPSVTGNPKGSVTPSPTTAPSPAPSPAPTERGARKRRAQLPNEWKPSPKDIDWQRNEHISDEIARRELPKFRDHWRSTGEPKADWSATWRNWLRRTAEREPAAATSGSRDPGWDYS